MTRRPLSEKQAIVLRALCKFVESFRRQPSYGELATLLNLKNIQKYITDLEAKGWIRRTGSAARAIEIPAEVWDEITGTGDRIPGAVDEITGADTAPETTGSRASGRNGDTP